MNGKRKSNAETQRRRDGNENCVRAFVAIEIPEDVVGALVTGRRELERTLPKARWVRKENQHLTLRFLGEVPRFQAREVVVFTSQLQPGGPVYTDFERIRLQ